MLLWSSMVHFVYSFYVVTVTLFSCFFFFYCSGHHRALHSFPTRRSSDLFDAADAVWRKRRFARARSHNGEPEPRGARHAGRSEEHTSELQSRFDLVCRLLLEKKKIKIYIYTTNYILLTHYLILL